MGKGPNDHGLSRQHIVAAVEASLRRLRTDWIDLYQSHAFDGATPIDETLRAFDDLVRAGKVRYVGCSNYPVWRLAGALRAATSRPRPSSPATTCPPPAERDLLPLARAAGIAVLPYNPWLADAHRPLPPGEPPPAGPASRTGSGDGCTRGATGRSRCSMWPRRCRGREGRGLALAQVALAWLLGRTG
jgi:aryl-alcohol dehydrogenase-like predicted oxidoreductase